MGFACQSIEYGSSFIFPFSLKGLSLLYIRLREVSVDIVTHSNSLIRFIHIFQQYLFSAILIYLPVRGQIMHRSCQGDIIATVSTVIKS